MNFKTYNNLKQSQNTPASPLGFYVDLREQNNADTAFHTYSNNTLQELELLLKHHIEDLKEYESEGASQEAVKDAKEDIKEIEKAIKSKKENLDEGKVETLQAVSALNKKIEDLIKKSSEPRDLQDERAFWAVIASLRKQREKLYKVNF